MEPLTKTDKKRLLRDNPDASADLIEEYQRLLVEKFANPVRPFTPPVDRAKIDHRNARIKELRGLLFPRSAQDI